MLLNVRAGLRVIELAADLREVAGLTLTVGPPRSNSASLRAQGDHLLAFVEDKVFQLPSICPASCRRLASSCLP